VTPAGLARRVEAGRFELVRARSVAELAEASAFRARVFEERRGVRFDAALEARRDHEGHVFLLFESGAVVATGRALAFPSGLSPLAEVAPDLAASEADSEIGRIAALRSNGAARYSLALLALGARWLLEHTNHRRYVAYCHPVLVDVYRAVGAVDTGRECRVPGRSACHRILCGSYEDAQRLAPIGPPPVLRLAV
jgi:hypothetical protein